MTDSLITRVKRVYDEVGALKIEKVNVENTLKALANVRLEFACKSVLFPFTPYTHTSSAMQQGFVITGICDFCRVTMETLSCSGFLPRKGSFSHHC